MHATEKQPVVVGVDTSENAAAAAAAGQALAHALDARLDPVHATPDAWLIPTTPMSFPMKPDEINEAAREAARTVVRENLAGVLTPDALARLTVRTGRAAVVLRDVISERNAQLAVLGGKHHSVLGRWVVGSTAHALVRTLDIPLFVSAAGHFPIRRIVAAIDLSDAAGPTVNAAVRVARLFDADLELLHVVEPLPIVPQTPLQFNDDDIYERAGQHVERHIWPFVDYARASTRLCRGPAVETIQQEAARRDADLVVLGSHGKGWVDRILIGSVTERVLSGLPTSMLVVPVLGPTASHTGRWGSGARGRHRPLELEA